MLAARADGVVRIFFSLTYHVFFLSPSLVDRPILTEILPQPSKQRLLNVVQASRTLTSRFHWEKLVNQKQRNQFPGLPQLGSTPIKERIFPICAREAKMKMVQLLPLKLTASPLC